MTSRPDWDKGLGLVVKVGGRIVYQTHNRAFAEDKARELGGVVERERAVSFNHKSGRKNRASLKLWKELNDRNH